ncbi:hypothetical protein CRE_29260 [Caenorhabditis remanei]|uniref:Uncharacterized protein n=1 Tax=Caenorhabditis remanei TaxID=31234 RepID=E3NMN9_CAERE|nr:hypothetical protein CRE_29260 [Caenorhabditis remanei]
MRFLIFSMIVFISAVMGYPYYQTDPYYQQQPFKLWYTPQAYKIGTGVVPSSSGQINNGQIENPYDPYSTNNGYNQNPYNPYYPYYPYNWEDTYNSNYYNPYNNH